MSIKFDNIAIHYLIASEPKVVDFPDDLKELMTKAYQEGQNFGKKYDDLFDKVGQKKGGFFSSKVTFSDVISLCREDLPQLLLALAQSPGAKSLDYLYLSYFNKGLIGEELAGLYVPVLESALGCIEPMRHNFNISQSKEITLLANTISRIYNCISDYMVHPFFNDDNEKEKIRTSTRYCLYMDVMFELLAANIMQQLNNKTLYEEFNRRIFEVSEDPIDMTPKDSKLQASMHLLNHFTSKGEYPLISPIFKMDGDFMVLIYDLKSNTLDPEIDEDMINKLEELVETEFTFVDTLGNTNALLLGIDGEDKKLSMASIMEVDIPKAEDWPLLQKFLSI